VVINICMYVVNYIVSCFTELCLYLWMTFFEFLDLLTYVFSYFSLIITVLSVSGCMLNSAHYVMLYVFIAVKQACGSEYFECQVIFQCIPKLSYLDGVFDCVDRTDEPNVGKRAFQCIVVDCHLSFTCL